MGSHDPMIVSPAIQFVGMEDKMAETAGQLWKKRLAAATQQQVVVEDQKRTQKQEQEALTAIASIPNAIDGAVVTQQNFIFTMLRPLNFEDVVCRDVDRFEEEVGGNPVRADQLTGAARMVFDWCTQNDLVCYVHGMGKNECGLIARLK